MKIHLTAILLFAALNCFPQQPSPFPIFSIGDRQKPLIDADPLILTPDEGRWSIATAWKEDWPADWHHANPTGFKREGNWHIVQGNIPLPQGDWLVQDAYTEAEGGRIKCIRRWEWTGKQPLDSVTLSIRWKIAATGAKAFLPGILYYGNPSGEKNGSHKVAVFHGKAGEEALFEEHRYPMPFACAEWQSGSKIYGAALHSLPSPVARGHHDDQWWSLGISAKAESTELLMLSGPVTYNGQRNTVKALQEGFHRYGETWMRVQPGMVIEKTFWLEAYPLEAKGTAFQRPVHTSIELFKPFYTEDLPTMAEILRLKHRFLMSRWVEGEGHAGFNMFPAHVRPQIVLGWAGQCEAPGYALQPLKSLHRMDKGSTFASPVLDSLDYKLPYTMDMVQRSLDHICTAPVGENGFPVVFDIGEKKWSNPDPVSEGQAMNSIALAIRTGRKNPLLKTEKWEAFLKKACNVHAKRLLDAGWKPVNTAEAFYISPLLLAAQLFDNQQYAKAALKAADYYADRHLSMDEPYWGGTLDATCEDKEGAWGAFQGFLAAYEFSKNSKYLNYAKHAGDVVLSYTAVWDIPLPAGRMADHAFKSRGWTGVSAQNQHLDVYGVVMTPAIYRLGELLGDESMKRLAAVMYRSCGQMISPTGAHGEQLQHTNFAQHGDMSDVKKLRGGYSESWTVFWITAHFLHAAAQLEEMGVQF